jgi:hypothetical protein
LSNRASGSLRVRPLTAQFSELSSGIKAGLPRLAADHDAAMDAALARVKPDYIDV